MNNPAAVLARDLGLSPAQAHHLLRVIKTPAVRWSELADICNAAPIAQRVQRLWVDYLVPSGYLSPRQLVQGSAVIAHGQRLGALPRLEADLFPDNTAPVLDPATWLQPPAWRLIRQQLASDLIHAGPPDPGGLRAVLPHLVVPLPTGLQLLPEAGIPVRAIGIETRDTAGRLELRIACWFDNGSAVATPWHDTPAPTDLHALGWGITAFLQQQPVERLAGIAPPHGQLIRNRRERPDPSWVEPPVRTIGTTARAGDGNTPGTSPRPHWRAAHEHIYWVGPGRKKRATRWLAAVWVDPLMVEDLAA